MRAALSFLLFIIAANAPAQTLNLGAAPSPPLAGSGVAALALADSLDSQAASLSSDAATRPRAKAALRTVAAAMIRAGEDAGPAGSIRILLGRTLADNLSYYDHFFNYGPDEPTLELLIHDAAAAVPRLQAAEPECERALRDLLAQSIEQGAMPSGDFGWCGPPFTAHPPLPEELDRLLSHAQHWTAYAHSALYLRDLIGGARIDPAITWMDPSARQAIDAELAQAQASLQAPDTLDSAVTRLRRLKAGGDLIRAADALQLAGPGAAQTLTRIRAALVQRLAVSPPDARADLRVLDAFGRVLSLVTAGAGLPADTTLLREIRPAYRAILDAARASEAKLAEALPTVLTLDDSMTQPGLLSAVAAHDRALQDLRLLVAASAALSRTPAQPSAEPRAAGGMDRVAARLLDLSQEVARKDRRDAALPRLRDFASRLVRSRYPPALDELRNALPGSSLAVLTGEQQAPLAGAFDDCRAAWLRALAEGDDAAAVREADQLDAMLDTLALLDDARRVHAALTPDDSPYARLQAWPGWQLSPQGLASIADGIEVLVSQAANLAVGGTPAAARDAVARTRTAFPAALLTGRLISITAGWRHIGWSPWELGTGPPLEGWSYLAEHRVALADICRYAEELPVARQLGDTTRAKRLDDYINAKASGVFATLD